ncbi:hypothetical protein SAMN05216409_1512 [Pseudomonas lutea]|uniref:Uncharacterized protein n=2 Tax=Pseudomonas TaxID=286 RepID=A0A9X8MI09_9PSED|nr:hypothetical protein [Pseudomonas lutea]SER56061.1 hypothetical protein SAMN05216409_1512 [Pseudomonas lutea]
MSEREAVTPEMIEGFVEAFHAFPAGSVAYDVALKAGIEGALAARTAPADQAEGTTSDKYRAELYDEVWHKARDMGYGNVTDALVALERLNQARAALHAENERLREECTKERLHRKSVEMSANQDNGRMACSMIAAQAEVERLREEVEQLNKALEVEKRSVENEVKRRNQYAKESDELDRQVEALKADAERYRWFKENCCQGENLVIAQSDGFSLSSWSGDDPDRHIDAAIDAARAAKPEVDHE